MIQPRTILDEAADITANDRQRYYGHPADNHGNTAALWTAYLERKFGFPGTLTGRDVCLMMVLLKISRDANKVNRDNLVDGAGYLRNAEMIEEREKEVVASTNPWTGAAEFENGPSRSADPLPDDYPRLRTIEDYPTPAQIQAEADDMVLAANAGLGSQYRAAQALKPTSLGVEVTARGGTSLARQPDDFATEPEPPHRPVTRRVPRD